MNSWFEITPRELHAKLLGPSNTSATKRHWCGGRRRDRRAWLRCPWAVAGPGCGARGRWRGLAGLRDDAPSEARGADGERAGRRPRAHQAARPRGRARRRPKHQRRHTTARARQRGRVPQYPPPCRLTQPLPRRGSGRMILSPGDGDASTGTCRPRRPLPGPPRRSGRRSRCAQGAGSGRCSAWWPGHRARRTRSSRP